MCFSSLWSFKFSQNNEKRSTTRFWKPCHASSICFMLWNGQEKNKQDPEKSQEGFQCLPLRVFFLAGYIYKHVFFFLDWSSRRQSMFLLGLKKTECLCFLAVLHLNISLTWCNHCNVAVLTMHDFVLVARIPPTNLRTDYSFSSIFTPLLWRLKQLEWEE